MSDLHQSCSSGVAESVADRGNRAETEISHDLDKVSTGPDGRQLEATQAHKNVLDATSTPLLTDTLLCTSNDDEHPPNIYDITSININGTDTLIMTDYTNKCVKSFHTSSDVEPTCISRLELQSRPVRIAMFEKYKLAVTLPDYKQIATVTVTPGLSLLSYITTNRQYYGLTALSPTTLAAGAEFRYCIDILDLSGNVLQSITSLISGEKILQNPAFLSTSMKGNILVSDYTTRSVVCVTTQGDVVFKYSPTGDNARFYPAGITSTDTGDILVVDDEGDKVIQLNESGQFVKDILTSHDGLGSPYCFHYDGNGRIYVKHGNGTVQVFTFK